MENVSFQLEKRLLAKKGKNEKIIECSISMVIWSSICSLPKLKRVVQWLEHQIITSWNIY